MKHNTLLLALVLFMNIIAVHSQAQCKANFSVENNNICYAGQPITFIDSSGAYNHVDSVVTETWNFGDGDGYTLSNLTHIDYYRIHNYNPGTYVASLAITTQSGCYDTISKVVYVYAKPVASFSGNANASCLSSTVNFVNMSAISIGTITKYSWNFGDGQTSTLKTPTHTYTTSNVYHPTLVVESNYGCKSVTDSITLPVTAPPKAYFSSVADSTVDGKINFTNNSYVGDTSVKFLWYFGDGSTGTDINPVHYYSSYGNYTVKLVVTSSLLNCADSITSNVYVPQVIRTCTPLPAGQNICLGQSIFFNDMYGGEIFNDTLLTQIWTYGDGTADTIRSGFHYSHPHTYATAGVYNVKVENNTIKGCKGTAYVNVTVNPIPNIRVTYTVAGCSVPYTVMFYDSTSLAFGTIAENLFNYGDNTASATQPLTHVYATGGPFTTDYKVRSAAGCTDSATLILVMPVKPIADFNFTKDPVDSQKVQFIDASTNGNRSLSGWYWNFGDGQTSSIANPMHIFPNKTATYTVKHAVTGSTGCVSDTISQVVSIDSVYFPITRQGNTGTEFWAGFGFEEKMVRLSGDVTEANTSLSIVTGINPARVTISLPGIPGASGFPVTYNISANSSAEISGFPTGSTTDKYNAAGLPDARLFYTGKSNRGIHITSTVPVSVWQHIYATNNTNGATILLPVDVWSNNYTVQTIGGTSNTSLPASYFYVIAKDDNTTINFTPEADVVDSSAATVFTQTHTADNVLYKAGNTYSVTLNKGQVFNAMGFVGLIGGVTTGVDLSGTRITTTDPLKKIAVFAGNGRLLIKSAGCTQISGSDNLIQQMFPKTVWGTRYLTVPTKTMEYNIYRIAVADTTTIVKVNGTPITGLINQSYYQIESNQPQLIEADKRIMVTQFIITPSCKTNTSGNNGQGDPEMIVLSPQKLGMTNTNLYFPRFRSSVTIGAAFINVVIKKEGVPSFVIDGRNTADTGISSYLNTTTPYNAGATISLANAFKPHPKDPDYYYARIKVGYNMLHTISADDYFTVVGYGVSAGESYGFNAGFNFNTTSYTFVGNGNWNDPSNWSNNRMPPNNILPLGTQITIASGAVCNLNIPIRLEDGATLTVQTSGKLIINGNLTIVQ